MPSWKVLLKEMLSNYLVHHASLIMYVTYLSSLLNNVMLTHRVHLSIEIDQLMDMLHKLMIHVSK